MTIQENLNELNELFSIFDNPRDKFIQLMDMAKELGGLTESEKIETNKIYGCTSQAWVVGAENIDGTFSFKTDSDAMIVKGLLGLLEKIFNGQNSENILLIQKLSLVFQEEKDGLYF